MLQEVAQAVQQVTPVQPVVYVVDWSQIFIVVFTNLGGIIGALAVLVAVIKGHFKVLDGKVDGNHNKVLDMLKDVVTRKTTEIPVQTPPRPSRKTDP